MAQAGIHSLLGMAVRKWTPKREWLLLGIVLGSLFPDADNLAVAVATIMKLPTEGLHRTFTHSLFTIVAVIAIFALVGAFTRKPRWTNLGYGLGIGIGMHILLDLLIWFNGVEILWPISSWVNLWPNYAGIPWFDTLMMPVEFLFLGLYFYALLILSRRQKTDADYRRTLTAWLIVQAVLLVVFTPLAYMGIKLYMTIYGALYLISLIAALVITARMRRTVEALA